MKKLHVNDEACIGCGACVAIDGTHFDFNEDGLSEVISNENIDTEEVNNAIASCPTNAINYIDDNCDCHNCNCTEECDCQNDDCQCENCTCGEDCECKGDTCHCNCCTNE